MDKLTAIKIKYEDGTYSDEIPVSVLSENVEWDSTHTLVDVLGSIDVDVTGTIQDQISQLFNEKVNYGTMTNYVSNNMNTYISNWLNNNVEPVGSAVVVDSSLSIEGAAADAKKCGDKIYDFNLLSAKGYDKYNGWINDAGTSWVQTDSSNYQYIVIPVTSGDKLDIEIGNSYIQLAGLQEYQGTSSPPVLSTIFPWNSKIIIRNTENSYIIPDDMNYLLICVVINGENRFNSLLTLKINDWDYMLSAKDQINILKTNLNIKENEILKLTKEINDLYLYNEINILNENAYFSSGSSDKYGVSWKWENNNTITIEKTLYKETIFSYIINSPSEIPNYIEKNKQYYFKVDSSNINVYPHIRFTINDTTKVIRLTKSQYITIPSEASGIILCIYCSDRFIGTATCKLQMFINYNESNNIYERRTIKDFTSLYNGYSHAAFPSLTFFNEKMIACASLSTGHITSKDKSNWGGVTLMSTETGENWKYIKMFTSLDFSGASGELRDTQIQPTPNGEYLILLTWTTYYDENQNVKHDNILALLDTQYNIIDYLVTKTPGHLYWGNPLITSDGHLIITGYKTGSVVIFKSTTVFNNKVSDLSFNIISLYNGNNASEPCCGYFDDKLVCIMRCNNNNNSQYIYTNDLTGETNWSSPQEIDIQVHAPKLLPYCSKKYLIFIGAFVVQDHYRVPCIGYIDINTGLISYGKIDDNLGYGGYIGFISYGDEEYGVIYYQEDYTEDVSTNWHYSSLFFKRINGKILNPKMIYLL